VTWQEQAACRTHRDLFAWLIDHPNASGPGWRVKVGQAKDVCSRCPVSTECLAYTRDVERPRSRIMVDLGVAGGLTYQERWPRRRLEVRTDRPSGSIDLCEQCGHPYEVHHASTRYCPECTPENTLACRARRAS
jgi:hypothetical protein